MNEPLSERELRAQRLGYALQRLAAELAQERQLTRSLRNENTKLQAELDRQRPRLPGTGARGSR
jgi:hypothetical protein